MMMIYMKTNKHITCDGASEGDQIRTILKQDKGGFIQVPYNEEIIHKNWELARYELFLYGNMFVNQLVDEICLHPFLLVIS